MYINSISTQRRKRCPNLMSSQTSMPPAPVGEKQTGSNDGYGVSTPTYNDGFKILMCLSRRSKFNEVVSQEQANCPARQLEDLSCLSLSEMAFWMEIDHPLHESGTLSVGNLAVREQFYESLSQGWPFPARGLCEPANQKSADSQYQRSISCMRTICTHSSFEGDDCFLYHDVQNILSEIPKSILPGREYDQAGCTPARGYLSTIGLI